MVVWSEIALRDIERLAAWLAADAALRAEQIVNRLIDRAESLSQSPDRGRTPAELRAIGDRTWREIIERPWRILYRIDGTTVQTHGVVDGRRSLEDILLERLLDG